MVDLSWYAFQKNGGQPWQGRDSQQYQDWLNQQRSANAPTPASSSVSSGQTTYQQAGLPGQPGDPFASQRSQYQGMLQGLMGQVVNAPQQQTFQQQAGALGDITQDPSYQFRFQQGQQALERSGAAKGFLGSGNILQELVGYGQGMASQEYQAQFNRQMAGAQFNQQAMQANIGNQQKTAGLLAELAGVNAGSPTGAAQLAFQGESRSYNQQQDWLASQGAQAAQQQWQQQQSNQSLQQMFQGADQFAATVPDYLGGSSTSSFLGFSTPQPQAPGMGFAAGQSEMNSAPYMSITPSSGTNDSFDFGDY